MSVLRPHKDKRSLRQFGKVTVIGKTAVYGHAVANASGRTKPQIAAKCDNSFENAETKEEMLEALRGVKRRHEQGKGTRLP